MLKWVNERLAVGDAIESLYDARKIAASGVTKVLNLRTNQDEAEWVQKAGMLYLANPTNGDTVTKPVDFWSTSINYFLQSLAESPSCKILVHCKHGEDRSPSTAYAMLRATGAPAVKAWGHVTDAVPKATGVYNKQVEIALKSLGYK